MTITAQVIADSLNYQGNRLTTLQLRYPRFIHAEELTHRRLNVSPDILPADDDSYFTMPDGFMYDRDLSRNASSSRAVPVRRLIEDIRRDPAMPIHWGKNQPGMQADQEHDEPVSILTRSGGCTDVDPRQAWLEAMEHAIDFAESFSNAGYHKQIVNRLLEPFSHINVVVSATDWANFFALRRHKDAQPEIKALADAIHEAINNSITVHLIPGEWHLPYVTAQDREDARSFCKRGRITRDEPAQWEIRDVLLKVSTARCARVSYATHGGKISTIDEDVLLYDRLVGSMPLHASPAEHQATPDQVYSTLADGTIRWRSAHYHGNFRGWCQHRKLLQNEYVEG